jgi:hypothetical protein
MKAAPFVAMIFGGLILLWPSGGDSPGPEPRPSDMVSEAFDTLEKLWRGHAVTAAGKLRSGEIATDVDLHKYMAAGMEPARRIAFESIAKSEQEALKDGWSAEKHAVILEGYAE